MFPTSHFARVESAKEGLQRYASRTIARIKRGFKTNKWPYILCLTMLLCLSPSLVRASTQPQESKNNPINTTTNKLTLNSGDETANVSRGASVTVSGDSSIWTPKSDSKILLELAGRNQSIEVLASSNTENGAQSLLEFIIPDTLELGEYKPRLLIRKGKDEKITKTALINVEQSKDNMLNVVGRSGSFQPVITSISPTTAIFPGKSGTGSDQKLSYTFKVIGSGFSPNPSDNHLVLYSPNKSEQNQYSQLGEPTVCWKGKQESCLNYKNIIGQSNSSRELLFKGLTIDEYANDIKGEIGVAIRVGDKTSNIYKVLISRVEYHTPMWWAMFGLLILVGAVFSVLRKTRSGSHPYSPSSLIIDPETNTYSLSRFQIHLWSAVGILSYLYLFLSKSLAQGSFEVTEIPSGLPNLVITSTATVIAAIGIDNARGGKASGPNIQPAWSDLICTGGNVLPDRVQFLAWTLTGVFVYTMTTLSQNPGVITDLPSIPTSFLQLSGISAAGYLGGKLLRAPGPVITSIDKLSYENKFIILILNGRNLSKDASFEIKNAKKSIKIPQELGTELDNQNNDVTKAIIKVVDPMPDSPTMASKLKIEIPCETPEDWDKDKEPYSITFKNPDTQLASWEFDGLDEKSSKESVAPDDETK